MRTALASGMLMLGITALVAANVPGERQAPATGGTGTAARGQAKPSAKASPSAGTRKIPCKTPEKAALCYWTHGRLSYYSVNFTWLLWKIGTHRLLKICDEPTYLSMQGTGDCADPDFPPNLERIYDADRHQRKRGGGHGDYYPPDAFGDFAICPLQPGREGRRQYACVESAKITFVQK